MAQESSSLIHRVLKKAEWLSEEERHILQRALVSSPLVSEKISVKLSILLCSILYAERKKKAQGKKLSIKIEKVLQKIGLHKVFCSTLGIWNFHVCHASRFGYSKREFQRLLEDKSRSTEIVIQYVLEDIGLDKPADFIIAEYHYSLMATSVAALQKALNVIIQKERSIPLLCEDGLIGPETYQALQKYAGYLPEFFSIKHIDENILLKTLEHFAQDHGISVQPFIPSVVIKRDGKFLLTILKEGMKDISRLCRLKGFFEDHVDILTSNKWGMTAYHYLTKEIEL